MTLIDPSYRKRVHDDPSACVEALMLDNERLSEENASLKQENERWGQRIKALEARLDQVRNLVR